MDSRLSSGLRFWLSLPGWLLLVAQGLGIGALALLGGGWQRQEKPPRQTLSLRIDYAGLLVLLEALPADLRLQQLSVETPPQGMTARLVLQDTAEEQADE